MVVTLVRKKTNGMMRGGNNMNAYIKQVVENRLEFLEMQEQEIENYTDNIKKQLIKEEEKLKKMREEKNAFKEE